ncbi:MAG: hypothetical protein JWL64_2683 [Frankiales bacterium]|nr:hypothetical protein [Frankiales bacterium]
MDRPAPLPTAPGQESVWSYPRPPRVEPDRREVVVVLGGVEVCRTSRAQRVLETSHPPGWYLPIEDALAGVLEPAEGTSYCEWKGLAAYFDLVAGGVRAPRAAWAYAAPVPAYASLRGTFSLYPEAVDEVLVAGERVRPQPGGFYGGWVTGEVVGPFKGGPGSMYW